MCQGLLQVEAQKRDGEEAERKVQAANENRAAAERALTAAQLKAATAISDADSRVPPSLPQRRCLDYAILTLGHPYILKRCQDASPPCLDASTRDPPTSRRARLLPKRYVVAIHDARMYTPAHPSKRAFAHHTHTQTCTHQDAHARTGVLRREVGKTTSSL